MTFKPNRAVLATIDLYDVVGFELALAYELFDSTFVSQLDSVR